MSSSSLDTFSYCCCKIKVCFNIIEEIQQKENKIFESKYEIEKIITETNSYVQKVSDKKVNDDEAKKYLNDKLMDIETNIQNVQKELKPHFDKIEELKKSSQNLYHIISEKYPDMQQKEIQEQIIAKLIELNLG